MTFAYVFSNGHTKIYVPGSKRKFLVSTTTTDDIWRWEQPGNDKLIIDKSFKDACHDVRLMPGHDVWAFQAERHIPEVIPDFSKYKKILIKGDNDTTGVMSVEKLLQRIGKGIPLFLPPKLGDHKIKDTDDAVVNGYEQFAKNLMECHLL